MARITLNGITFDPVAQAKGLESASLRSADASQSNYVLIQTRGRLTDDQKTQLTDLGVVIHEYVDKNTYICGYQPTDLRPIRALPFVVWADVYLPSFKIAPSLRRTPTTKAPLSELLAPPRPLTTYVRLTSCSTTTSIRGRLSSRRKLPPPRG